MVYIILQIEIDNQRSLYYIPYCRTIGMPLEQNNLNLAMNEKQSI